MINKKLPVRIVGIDPGLNTSGYAVVDTDGNDVQLIEAGIVRSKRASAFENRLQEIYEGVLDVLKSFEPDHLSLEEVFSHYQRPKTAILMGHARGVINLAAAHRDVKVFDYSATQVKKLLTGNGRAPKEQVQMSVTNHFDLKEVPTPNDVADAMAIALCHAYLERFELDTFRIIEQ